MSIKDNVNEISENNVTIAENLEKVYNAGMRAGLAQDPDYSEGYDDGYEQGLTDSSGVVWEDLLSGKVPVGKAREADHADKATNAENAENAKNANHAKSADNATNANRATEANHAAEADHSVEADHATEADHSVEADHATNADKANTAVSADHATTATVANSTNSFNGVLPIENGGTGADNASQAIVNLGIANYQKPWDVNENIDSIVTNMHDSTSISTKASPPDSLLPCEAWALIEDEALSNYHNKTSKFTHSIPMINSGRVYLHFSPTIDYTDAPWDHLAKEGEYMELRVYSGDTVVYEEHRLLTKDDLITQPEERRPEWILVDVVKGVDVKLEAVQRRRIYNSGGTDSYGFSRFRDIYLMANMDTPYKYTSLIGMKSPSYFEQ